MAQVIFSPSATSIAALLKEATPLDVKTYISVSNMSAEKVITESELPKLLGIAPATNSHNTAHNGVTAGSTAGNVTLTLPKKAAAVSAVAAAPVVVTAVASAPIAKKKSFASPQPKAHSAPSAGE